MTPTAAAKKIVNGVVSTRGATAVGKTGDAGEQGAGATTVSREQGADG
jgi:hypothetical protein